MESHLNNILPSWTRDVRTTIYRESHHVNTRGMRLFWEKLAGGSVEAQSERYRQNLDVHNSAVDEMGFGISCDHGTDVGTGSFFADRRGAGRAHRAVAVLIHRVDERGSDGKGSCVNVNESGCGNVQGVGVHGVVPESSSCDDAMVVSPPPNYA